MVAQKLYKHKDNTDVAVEVLKFVKVSGKDYARIKVCWWNVVPSHPPYCMNFTQYLTDATIQGNARERQKYPLSKWLSDWEVL